MFDDDDKSSKTEDASEHKLRKAKEEGNVPKSKEINNAFTLLAGVLVVLFVMPYMAKNMLQLTAGLFQSAADTRINSDSFYIIFKEIIIRSITLMLPIFIVFLIFALAGGFIQNGIIISTKPMEPKLSKISIIKGFGRVFSLKSVVELVKAIIKSILIASIIYLVALSYKDVIPVLSDMDIEQDVILVHEFVVKIMFAAAIFISVIAIVDFLYQKYNFNKDMKMSMQDLKDEHKDTNGDPFVKSRQAQIRMEKARARMMQEVPNADVVVTNPTHFAVALRYDQEKEPVPRVVAKGHDHIAQKIKELAKEHKVPIIEDVQLARTLWKTVELDDIIPVDLYQAVADVIAFILKMKKKKTS
ncbi:MAG: flagellar biosynthesis protein FlhB [Proteobacteria bacterium]|nr:flagellar biosynthesis protein FlhB [Pseudomonadota bacterium]